MDLLIEILVGLFIELPLEAAAESKRIKPWIKGLFLVLFWIAVEAALIWAFRAMLLDGEAWPMLLFTGGGCLAWTWIGVQTGIELIRRRTQ